MPRLAKLAIIFIATISVACGTADVVRVGTDLYTSGSEVRIQSGDSVKVTVYGHEDLSGEFEVNTVGQISLPLVGRIPAAGLTAIELENSVVGALMPDYLLRPQVGVEIINQNPIYVLGEVRAPGQYEHLAELTVYAAVALAGGYTYRAKTNVAFIVRFADPEKLKQKVTPETVLQPGDVIEIPERLF